MNTNIEREMDKEMVERKFKEYPKLETVVCAGTVSLKATRDILGIDRHECYLLYLDLLEGGAIYGSGSNCYRATSQLKAYVLERMKKERTDKESGEQNV